MHYLIDGHNLIPFMDIGGLQNPNKEEELIKMLHSIPLGSKGTLHVFFDKAPAGRAGTINVGKITVHRVQASLEADDAILQFLEKQNKKACEFSIVSDDHKVQNGVRYLGGKIIGCRDFFRKFFLKNFNAIDYDVEKPQLSPENDKDIQDHFLYLDRKH